jgi:hypothetical protein
MSASHVKVIDPPCDYGHTRQAMECPSCSEQVTGNPSSDEWRTWFERRYGKRASSSAASREQDGQTR